MSGNKITLSTKPYKGTRDFFPNEMRLRNRVFSRLSQLIESFGYEPYDGPMLESFDLYAAKTGEEIVNEQLYSFEDRGGRKVAIRPEMTPTLARMVSQKARDLARPIRWYSFPNLWRYESPQRGRLREHWQLNLDIFGIDSIEADIEVIAIAIELLKTLGADNAMFELKYNNRKITDVLLRNILELNQEALAKTAKIIDKKAKISNEEFEKLLFEAGLGNEKTQTLLKFFQTSFENLPLEFPLLADYWQELNNQKNILEKMGYADYIVFSPEIMRGFDYYTGTVFEVFDKNPQNRRSLFGGGRYDNLLELFGVSGISGVGFGMGDVTLFDFLSVHNLLPQEKRQNTVMVAIMPENEYADIWELASQIRKSGISIEIPWGVVKLGRQFQSAQKKDIRFVVIQGEQELKNRTVQIKDLEKGTQVQIAKLEFMDYLRENLSS